MKKEDNEWEIEPKATVSGGIAKVTINGTSYLTDQYVGAICHSILLLVDAINDKK